MFEFYCGFVVHARPRVETRVVGSDDPAVQALPDDGRRGRPTIGLVAVRIGEPLLAGQHGPEGTLLAVLRGGAVVAEICWICWCRLG